MLHKFSIEDFIQNKVTKRTQSLLAKDIEQYKNSLRIAIKGKAVLVIGGAGTIGSNYGNL